MSKRRSIPKSLPRGHKGQPLPLPTTPLDGLQPHLPPTKPFKPAVTAPTTTLHGGTPPATQPIAKPTGAPRFNDPPNEKHQL